MRVHPAAALGRVEEQAVVLAPQHVHRKRAILGDHMRFRARRPPSAGCRSGLRGGIGRPSSAVCRGQLLPAAARAAPTSDRVSSLTGWKLVSTHTGGKASSAQCSQPGCRPPRPWKMRWASVGISIVAMAFSKACMGCRAMERRREECRQCCRGRALIQRKNRWHGPMVCCAMAPEGWAGAQVQAYNCLMRIVII